ncbi:hypothetical protein HK102_013669, partial [Quaeritorhiza haematococci]
DGGLPPPPPYAQGSPVGVQKTPVASEKSSPDGSAPAHQHANIRAPSPITIPPRQDSARLLIPICQPHDHFYPSAHLNLIRNLRKARYRSTERFGWLMFAGMLAPVGLWMAYVLGVKWGPEFGRWIAGTNVAVGYPLVLFAAYHDLGGTVHDNFGIRYQLLATLIVVELSVTLRAITQFDPGLIRSTDAAEWADRLMVLAIFTVTIITPAILSFFHPASQSPTRTTPSPFSRFLANLTQRASITAHKISMIYTKIFKSESDHQKQQQHSQHTTPRAHSSKHPSGIGVIVNMKCGEKSVAPSDDPKSPTAAAAALCDLPFIFSDTRLMRAFTRFLESEFAVENLLFLNAVGDYRLAVTHLVLASSPLSPHAQLTYPTPAPENHHSIHHPTHHYDLLKLAQSIYDEFLKPGAVNEVNVPHQIKFRIQSQLRLAQAPSLAVPAPARARAPRASWKRVGSALMLGQNVNAAGGVKVEGRAVIAGLSEGGKGYMSVAPPRRMFAPRKSSLSVRGVSKAGGVGGPDRMKSATTPSPTGLPAYTNTSHLQNTNVSNSKPNSHGPSPPTPAPTKVSATPLLPSDLFDDAVTHIQDTLSQSVLPRFRKSEMCKEVLRMRT